MYYPDGEYTYYVIRHKATGELMPQMKRGRGYSHWNPSNPNEKAYQSLGIPRLIDTRRRAAGVISQWNAMPNARYSGYQTYDGDWDDGIDFKSDGRKKEDLEIVEVILKVKG